MYQQNNPRLGILNGWKEIASYLGKGVRSVQRYERESGLPVHRPAGRYKGSVIATKAELDAWITASPIREASRLPHLTQNNASSLEEFRRHIEELRRLREETGQLRRDLRVSLAELRASIQTFSARQLLPSRQQPRLPRDVRHFDLATPKVH